jgi:cell wall-associated NlpC family hydrolase
VRGAYAKTKEVAERNGGEGTQYQSGTDYAQTKTEQAARSAAQSAGRGATGAAKKAVTTARDAHNAIKDVRQGTQGAGQATGTAAKQTARTAQQQATGTAAKQAASTARKQAIHAASRQAAQRSAARTAAGTRQATVTATRQATTNTASAAKAAVKQGTKATVKSASKSIKTAGATAKTAIKTSKHTAQAARTTAKATQIAARSAAQAARAASRATAAALRAAARGIAVFTKMAIAAVKSLAAVIAAGGWMAVAVILVICLVGLIAASAFGIFFTGGDMGDGNPTLREAIADINQEHQDRIEQIKTDNPHDDLMLSGTRAKWQEVLAIYAVKATTDTDSPLDTITLDGHRQQMLRDVFWDMNTIEYRTEDRQVTEIIAVEQEDGTVTEETETYTRRTLYITLLAKTAAETAATSGFTQKQTGLVDELLTPAYASAWQSVLYGIHSGSGDIVEVATSQIGNTGGEPFWSWYGFSSRVEWCACFVSWCANETGYIQSGVIPRFSYCPTGAGWFRDAGRWQSRGYAPKPGDIIFFDWEQDGTSDHVGIVEFSDGTTVHTIEGNSSNAVRRNTYDINNSAIYGYGVIE